MPSKLYLPVIRSITYRSHRESFPCQRTLDSGTYSGLMLGSQDVCIQHNTVSWWSDGICFIHGSENDLESCLKPHFRRLDLQSPRFLLRSPFIRRWWICAIAALLRIQAWILRSDFRRLQTHVVYQKELTCFWPLYIWASFVADVKCLWKELKERVNHYEYKIKIR